MSEAKGIAKNTMYLYIRMLINMGVSLYTSRITLQTLGVEDFGIYNLVGGVVVLFTFLNNPMTSTTQRFINVEKASKLTENVNKIFNISLAVHLIISLLILILAETIGLWFLNSKLNISPDRKYAANVVFQLTIITTVISVMRVPFNAMIIAYERMSFYALLGIVETVSKLSVVYLLLAFPSYDKLILFAFLSLIVSLGINLIFYSYCRKNFIEETHIKRNNDKAKVKELVSFSGWMLFGQLAVMAATQGLNMILNIFHGVVLNAAVGIATQVNTALYSFIGNFQVAFNPQIVQSYASNEHELHKKMVLTASKYSFFLMVLLSAPVLFYTHPILTLWLGNNLPTYVEHFVKIIIFCSFIDALAGPFWISAQAIGNIKAYNITLTSINLFTLPIAYFLLKMGYTPPFVFIGKLVISTILQLFRYYFINKYLIFNKNHLYTYFIRVGIIAIAITGLLFLKSDKNETILQMFVKSIIIDLALSIIILYIGLDTKERSLLWNLAKNKLINNR